MTVKEHLGYNRALSNARIALTFLGHALTSLPAPAPERAALLDAQDSLRVALDAIEERAK